jgi:cell filamentation protein
MPADPYVYPGTNVLRNRLGIRDASELAAREAAISAVRIAQLERSFVSGGYDIIHLQAVHRSIFGDIYPWAGEFRTVALGKGGDIFALPGHIVTYLTGALVDLAHEDHLHALARDSFVERLAHYYAEINAVHPFREGNGRTQRAFLGQIAKAAGRPIAWTRLDPERNVRATRESHRGSNASIREMIDDLVDTP